MCGLSPGKGLTADLAQARALIVHWQAQLAERHLQHRPPPPEPVGCCGRGCNGCVWEGFYAALACWQEDAQALLALPGR